MSTEVRDALLRRSVDHLGSFAEEVFKVGVSLVTRDEGRCLCSLRPASSGTADACRTFFDSLFLAESLRLRCPEGLSVIVRPVELSASERLLIASHGFLEEGAPDPAPGAAGRGRRKPLRVTPRLTAAQVRLLEDYIGMGADLVGTMARTAGETALEEFREEAWHDLLCAPTLIGASSAIGAVRAALPTLANSREPLFLDGEQGTGRGLVAMAIHRLGPRHARPYIAENLAVLPEHLQEAEIFGGPRARGLLHLADGGTLYLAAVELLSPPAQDRLLAFLSGNGVDQGPRAPQVPDVRIISSSGAALEGAGRRRGIRTDLAKLLRSLTLTLPPLRERLEDLPLLVEHLLHRNAARLGAPPPAVASDTLEALKKHIWNANVRELEEELERAAVGRSEIRLEDLSDSIARTSGVTKAAAGTDLRTVVGEIEVDLIERTLAETNWNKSRTARQLGLSRLGLQKKIDRYGIDRRR